MGHRLRTVAFKASVRAAVTGDIDPARRVALLELCDDLEDLQLEIGVLRRLIEELDHGGPKCIDGR